MKFCKKNGSCDWVIPYLGYVRYDNIIESIITKLQKFSIITDGDFLWLI